MTLNPADVHRLVRFATKRTGSPSFDEDLAQEAMLRALAAFRRTEQVKHPHAFLTKVVLDTVRDHWRRRRLWEDIESIDERLLAHLPHFEADIDAKRLRKSLREALSMLDPVKRATVALFYQKGLSIREIAGRQSRSVSAVKMELMRTRQELAETMRARTERRQ